MPSSLAATLTPSPRMSSPSIRMSPRLIPILKSIRRSCGIPSFLWAITACAATAYSTALAGSLALRSEAAAQNSDLGCFADNYGHDANQFGAQGRVLDGY